MTVSHPAIAAASRHIRGQKVSDLFRAFLPIVGSLLFVICGLSPGDALAQQPPVAAPNTCRDMPGVVCVGPQEPAVQSEPGKENNGSVVSATPKAANAPKKHGDMPTLGLNVIRDQKRFWTLPFRVREENLPWILPISLGTVGLIASDQAIERRLPQGQSTINRSGSLSNYGVAAFGIATGGTYLLGRVRHNDHLRETGLLAAEAGASSYLATQVIKPIAGRDRPLDGDGRGRWLQSGSSFPSEHSAAAWSVATVIAGQYPGWMTKLLAYGGASAVSASRVTGRQHFASDVVIGSAIGWYMGNLALSRASDAGERKKEQARLGIFTRSESPSWTRSSKNMGSPYVPLDSWVYPAFDRLSALGYALSGFAGLRPWTRMECARLLAEAADALPASFDPVPAAGVPVAAPTRTRSSKTEAEARSIYSALSQEFGRERGLLNNGGRNQSAQLESVYTRFTVISGQPLTDGYYFGQTLINDFGRPFQEGFNNVTGLSGHATAGPLVAYLRGEYQRAPSASALPLSARQAMARADQLPLPPDSPTAAINRFEFLDSYAGLNLSNWALTFGRQSLSWGPGAGGAMMLGDNIEPIDMLRLNRVSPFKLPSILGRLGPMRLEIFIGQLNGYEFVFSPLGLVGSWGQSLTLQPYIHGQKLSFKPTPNFEFGLSRTVIYGGPGYPVNLRTLGRTIFSTTNESAGTPNKPGDRRSGVDLTYRIPKLRNWLTFYADGFTDDQFSPIAYADRSIWRAGLYMPRVPGLPKLDLRTEGLYSDNPIGGIIGPGYFYSNSTWKTGYRNAGNLIGSWIGRAGQGAQAWATYHFNPKNDLQLNFRHQKVSQEFLPGGGTLADFGVKGNWWVRPSWSVSGYVQYEKWNYPVITSGQKNNVTTSIQLTFWPGQLLAK